MTFLFENFNKKELTAWVLSLTLIMLSQLLLGNTEWAFMLVSMVGISALIYTAKGHVMGPLIMILFSITYSLISLSFDYYGEAITYGGMTLPMSILALIAWVKHPSSEKNQVKTAVLTKREWLICGLYSIIVTTILGAVLYLFDTPNLVLSTISVTTSFVAVYLTYKRSQYYAVAYALNDLILIGLWVYASTTHEAYMPLVVCFSLFLIYDIYGYIAWNKMSNKQKSITTRLE